MDQQQQQQQLQESSSSVSPCRVPPGFRFHPTEEELVGYYLARKVVSPNRTDLLADIIQEVDLYRIEPWDLQGRCNKRLDGVDDQQQTQTTTESEWYFFSYKDRKYPSGTRTNRATAAGFWKATGRDKPVLSSRCGGGSSRSVVIGMRKTLVFYRGRAPNGRKTEWIMHEYRLQSNEHAPAQEEGWVVCRAFQKPIPNHLQIRPSLLFPTTYAAAGYYDDGYDRHPFLLGGGGGGGPAAAAAPPPAGNNFFPPQYSAPSADDDDLQLESKKKHLCFSTTTSILPQLESPTAAVDSCCSSATAMMTSCYSYSTERHDDEQLMILLQQQQQQQQQGGQAAAAAAGAIDWSFLDTLLATASHDYPFSTYSLQ